MWNELPGVVVMQTNNIVAFNKLLDRYVNMSAMEGGKVCVGRRD